MLYVNTTDIKFTEACREYNFIYIYVQSNLLSICNQEIFNTKLFAQRQYVQYFLIYMCDGHDYDDNNNVGKDDDDNEKTGRNF